MFGQHEILNVIVLLISLTLKYKYRGLSLQLSPRDAIFRIQIARVIVIDKARRRRE